MDRNTFGMVPASSSIRLLHHARIVPTAGESYDLKNQRVVGMVKTKRETALDA